MKIIQYYNLITLQPLINIYIMLKNYQIFDKKNYFFPYINFNLTMIIMIINLITFKYHFQEYFILIDYSYFIIINVMMYLNFLRLDH
jgi:hypothetical protein